MVLNLDKLWFQSICNLLSLNYVVGRIMVLATKSLAYTARLFRFCSVKYSLKPFPFLPTGYSSGWWLLITHNQICMQYSAVSLVISLLFWSE